MHVEQPWMWPAAAPAAQEGDVEQAQQLVERSGGIQRARELALHHAQQASHGLGRMAGALC